MLRFGYDDSVMRHLAILFIHLIVTIARLLGPGGARSVVAETLLVKHQLLIINRSRERAPPLRPTDRLIAGLCAILMRPTRLLRSAIVLKPSTILSFHRALVKRKYRLLFTPKTRGKPGPRGPSPELISAIVEMKRRNASFGYQRIAEQISLVFAIERLIRIWYGAYSPNTTGRSRDPTVRPGSLSWATAKTVCGVWIFFDVNR